MVAVVVSPKGRRPGCVFGCGRRHLKPECESEVQTLQIQMSQQDGADSSFMTKKFPHEGFGLGAFVRDERGGEAPSLLAWVYGSWGVV